MRKIAIALATLAALTAPAVAATKNAGDQKAEDKQDSSSCHSYVQNPDGSWTPTPCQEIGAPTHTQHKSAGHGLDDEHH